MADEDTLTDDVAGGRKFQCLSKPEDYISLPRGLARRPWLPPCVGIYGIFEADTPSGDDGKETIEVDWLITPGDARALARLLILAAEDADPQ